MTGNINEILEKATAKLKEMYGDDFKFEDDDEFVFALNNGILFISFALQKPTNLANNNHLQYEKISSAKL